MATVPWIWVGALEPRSCVQQKCICAGYGNPSPRTIPDKNTALQVLLIRAVPAEKAELRDVYQCPVYATEARFRQEIFTAQLKTKQPSNTWTMAGVALFLDVV